MTKETIWYIIGGAIVAVFLNIFRISRERKDEEQTKEAMIKVVNLTKDALPTPSFEEKRAF